LEKKNCIIWVVAISLAIVSSFTALGSIAKTTSPELAITFFPKNGFGAQAMVSGLTMASVLENNGQFPEQGDPAWNTLAREAFRSEPATPDAIAVLALSKERDFRRELMEKAFELSRRQRVATGWLIADSAKRDDLSELLEYYDTLLRTSSAAAAVVMPVMAQALSDERSVAFLADLLSTRPPWNYRFWWQVNSTPEALHNAVQLRKSLHAPDETKEIYADGGLVSALIGQKYFIEAEDLYDFLSQNPSNGSIIRNSSFGHEPEYPPLDWQVFSTGEYGAAVVDGNMQISAISNSRGLFARQLVNLPSGIIQIDTKFATKIPDDASLEIRLSCAESIANPPLPVRLPLIDQGGSQQISNQASGCSYFWLDIAGRASENGDGFNISVESVSISPRS